jgi:hypothetical protein
LANGRSQEEFDKSILDAIKQGEAQKLSDAQFESQMNQWGISAADVARVTGLTPEAVQTRLDLATPTTPEEIAYNQKAMDELAIREAQNQTQIGTNQKAYEEQQRLNNLASAEQQRLNNLASAEQQRLNELANQQQIGTNQKAYEGYLANQAKLAGPAQGFAQNFANYQAIAPGAQYNPAVTPGGASPYSLIMGQMKPFSNPYANMPVNTPLGGYDPALYERINAANLAKAAAETAATTAQNTQQESTGLAKGGMVHGGLMFGMNPPGPDDGAVNLDMGEYVIKKSSVDKYGRGLLDMINEGKVPAKKMKSLLG